MQPILRGARRALVGAALVLATAILLRGFDARRLPALKAWHRFSPGSEVRAREMTDRFTLADYLRRETQAIAETRREIGRRLDPEDRNAANRYFEDSPLHPSHFVVDWNRTFELAPERVRGGAVLIHGLTDSPYSMRAVARIFRDSGIYALCPRMPGHGTVPGALVDVEWEDWQAAVRVAARHVARRIGPGAPFYVVGYSSGGALAVRYALDALDDTSLPRPERLVLFSPMIGVTPLAALARPVGALAILPFFEKSRWLEIAPEYIPFKYNSFPTNAAHQTLRLTRSVERALRSAEGSGAIRRFPPTLVFQSLVDFTVSTNALVHRMFDRLPANGSELVIFDRNRESYLRTLQPSSSDEMAARPPGTARRYTVTIVTNANPQTAEVVARTTRAGETAGIAARTGLSWPPQTFSLSHVALPFSPSDPLYGSRPDAAEFYGVRLGTLAPRGERAGLIVGMDQLMRLTCNPFFPYVESRVREWIASPLKGTGTVAGKADFQKEAP